MLSFGYTGSLGVTKIDENVEKAQKKPRKPRKSPEIVCDNEFLTRKLTSRKLEDFSSPPSAGISLDWRWFQCLKQNIIMLDLLSVIFFHHFGLAFSNLPVISFPGQPINNELKAQSNHLSLLKGQHAHWIQSSVL
jgi:hypothetical protein